jgi:hypothetical protein
MDRRRGGDDVQLLIAEGLAGGVGVTSVQARAGETAFRPGDRLGNADPSAYVVSKGLRSEPDRRKVVSW